MTLFGYRAYAQWQFSGNDPYYLGDIGIGIIPENANGSLDIFRNTSACGNSHFKPNTFRLLGPNMDRTLFGDRFYQCHGCM